MAEFNIMQILVGAQVWVEFQRATIFNKELCSCNGKPKHHVFCPKHALDCGCFCDLLVMAGWARVPFAQRSLARGSVVLQ